MTNKPTCQTCRHWTRNQVSPYLNEQQYSTSYGNCGSAAFVSGDADGDRTDQLVYWDIEDYRAAFVTGQDFGCIFHEAAP